MSTTGGYCEYIGGVQYIRGFHDACGGYHEYIGDVMYIGGYIKIQKETIDRLALLTFARSFHKQCFAIIDALYSNYDACC